MKYLLLSIIGLPSLAWAYIRLEQFYVWLLKSAGFSEHTAEGLWILTGICVVFWGTVLIINSMNRKEIDTTNQ